MGSAAKPNVYISANPTQISISITVDTDEEEMNAYIQAKEKKDKHIEKLSLFKQFATEWW